MKNYAEYPTACRGDENMHYAEGYKGDGKSPLSSKANGLAVWPAQLQKSCAKVPRGLPRLNNSAENNG